MRAAPCACLGREQHRPRCNTAAGGVMRVAAAQGLAGRGAHALGAVGVATAGSSTPARRQGARGLATSLVRPVHACAGCAWWARQTAWTDAASPPPSPRTDALGRGELCGLG
jgi:hypothetical protein